MGKYVVYDLEMCKVPKGEKREENDLKNLRTCVIIIQNNALAVRSAGE